MSLLEAILMGIVQGLTEFLPVSSSGHLALFKHLFGVEGPGLFFDLLLHLGTLCAVFVVYHRDIWRLICEFFGIIGSIGKNIGILIRNCKNPEKEVIIRVVSNSYREFVVLILVSSIPTAIVGLVARDLVKIAEDFLIIPGICLILTSILLFIADRLPAGWKRPKNTTYTNAFIIGICQGIATLPGLSRSGTTITACLGSGMERKFAVKYSFIMSIPAILGATLLEVTEVDFSILSSGDVLNYIVGAIVAGFYRGV